ncbi:hypothetical protein MRX96_033596 [Rhipicephalus microplus]
MEKVRSRRSVADFEGTSLTTDTRMARPAAQFQMVFPNGRSCHASLLMSSASSHARRARQAAARSRFAQTKKEDKRDWRRQRCRTEERRAAVNLHEQLGQCVHEAANASRGLFNGGAHGRPRQDPFPNVANFTPPRRRGGEGGPVMDDAQKMPSASQTSRSIFRQPALQFLMDLRG